MTKDEMIDAYLAGVGDVRNAVTGMTREQLIARPVAGKWSTLEVVCHIADFEPIMADRMKRVIAFDRPPLASLDENPLAAKLAYQQRDLDEELAVIDGVRRQMVRILRTLPPEAFDRVGIHSERGPKTLADLLTGTTNHVVHHLPFVHEKRRALCLAV